MLRVALFLQRKMQCRAEIDAKMQLLKLDVEG
jgi:hypothetical protein